MIFFLKLHFVNNRKKFGGCVVGKKINPYYCPIKMKKTQQHSRILSTTSLWPMIAVSTTFTFTTTTITPKGVR